MTRRRAAGMALLAAGLLALVAGCGSPAGRTSPAGRSVPPVSPTAAQPGDTGTPVVSASPAPHLAALPLITCPTTIALATQPPPATLPSSRTVAVPSALQADLAVYADDQGTMELVAPRGWDCTAAYGADGSGGVAVYPPSETPPARWTAGWAVGAQSAAWSAVVGTESSACYTCTLAQACPLFASAATTLNTYLNRQACQGRRGEVVTQVSAGLAAFEDPPGVAGDGVPSGGQLPANGVVTYYPGAAAGSWRATCTLPASDKAECTTALNAFISWYGRQ